MSRTVFVDFHIPFPYSVDTDTAMSEYHFLGGIYGKTNSSFKSFSAVLC